MLTLKHLAINSFNENLAYIHRDCSAYKVDDIESLTKVEIHGGVKPVFAFLQVVDDERVVKPTELALNTEAFNMISLPEGANITMTLSSPPPSLASIKRKIAGNILSSGEYSAIVNDIATKRYSNMDIASFLVASGSFMTAPEVLSFTEALVGDNTLHWDNESIVVDHHCLGGVPGNKTDIIITAIVSAYGLPMPKTASRSLTSCAGVADTMAVLANVDLDEADLKRLIKENRGAIVNYEGLSIAAANKLVSSVERNIGLTQLHHIAASILAIKLAAGVTHLVIDIPVGPNSRIKRTGEAMRLRKLIEYVGDMLSIEIDAVITDGSEPIGNGVDTLADRGTSGLRYKGTFDGRGYRIDGLELTAEGAEEGRMCYLSLFGILDKEAVVKNLVLGESCRFVCTGEAENVCSLSSVKKEVTGITMMRKVVL